MERFKITSLEDVALLKESSDLECKLALGRDGHGALPKDVWESYSALANTDGGTIVLGVKEKQGRFSVEGIAQAEKVTLDLVNTANNPDKVSVNLFTHQSVYQVDIADKTILVIDIRRAKRHERPVYLNRNPLRGSYCRRHEADHKLSQEQVKRMLAEQVEDARDSQVLPAYGLEDIDLESLRVYRQSFANLNPNHVWNELPDLQFLNNIGGWRTNRETGESGLTTAGLLMFGRHPVIQEQFPYYMLDYQERPEVKTEQRWIDRITLDGSWSGNLYDFARKVYRKLTQDIKVPFALVSGVRQEDTPVHIALREALANAIVHADYTGRASVLVVKRPDMFGFRNPGLMRVPIKIALQGGEPDCRNRFLHQMFRYIKFGEQAGSGLPKILDGWRSQHWSPPLLQEAVEPYDQTLLELKMTSLYPKAVVDKLSATFGRRFAKLTELERTLAIAIHAAAYLSHQQLVTQTGAYAREVTLALVKLEKLDVIQASGQQKSKVYHRPDVEIPTPDNEVGQFIAESLIVSKPSNLSVEHRNPELSPDLTPDLTPDLEHVQAEWAKLQQIAQPVKGKSRQVGREAMIAAILSLCDEGRFISISDLAELLDMKVDTLRKNYLTPLVRAEQLKLAYPTEKNHPKQAYSKNI